jgi:CBS domain-containing protein
MAMDVGSMLERKARAVVTIAPGATLTEAVLLLREHGIGALVVSIDGSRVDGMLSERDVVRRLAIDGADALEMTVARAMSTPVIACSPSDELPELMAVMTERRVRHLPVLVEQRLVGLVSIGDVVKHRVDELEHENRALFEYLSRAQ